MTIYQEARCGWKKGRVLYELSKESKKKSYHNFLNNYFSQKEIDNYGLELMNSAFYKKFRHQKANFELDRGPICMNSLQFLYCLIRKYKPQVFIETGIHFGGSTAIILFGLHMNQQGKLISIDKWTEAPIEHIGYFVPDDLKYRWEPIKGFTRDVLPTLNDSFSFFLHDSAHSYRNMTMEYEWATKHIDKEGFIISHDIGANNSFFDFCANHNLQYFLIESDFSGRYSLGIVQVGRRQKVNDICRPNVKIPKEEKYTTNPFWLRNNFDEGRLFAKRLEKEFEIKKEMVKWKKGIADEYVILKNGKKIGRIAPRFGAIYGGYCHGKSFRILNKKEEDELLKDLRK